MRKDSECFDCKIKCFAKIIAELVFKHIIEKDNK